jgi:hypothetical protein
MFSVNTGLAEDIVEFADSNLKEAVETELEKKDPTPTDMLELRALPSYILHVINIKDLAGLEHAQNLEKFALHSSPISDFSIISKMENLETLKLGSCDISDVTHIANVIKNLEKLEVLSLRDNQISDISSLAEFKNLKELHLHGNPLNEQAYKVYIPQIRKNNPGVEISMNFRPEQLIAPAVFFFVFLMSAIYAVCRVWKSKGWIFELLVGLVSAGLGCYLGLGAQFLYDFPDVDLRFFDNGYENPMWVGGVIGGVFGLLTGVWFAQHLRSRLNAGQSKGRIVGKGILVGIGLGVLCSTAVHILLMIAYHNLDLRPMLIGMCFGVGAGIVAGLIISVVFILSLKMGLIKIKE